ncbi:MAG: hypothetical protein K2X66_12415 [Cyanobacteria bacterium]|nr:hypothetical protein [Cyanobacteriota bacterium]
MLLGLSGLIILCVRFWISDDPHLYLLYWHSTVAHVLGFLAIASAVMIFMAHHGFLKIGTLFLFIVFGFSYLITNQFWVESPQLLDQRISPDGHFLMSLTEFDCNDSRYAYTIYVKDFNVTNHSKTVYFSGCRKTELGQGQIEKVLWKNNKSLIPFLANGKTIPPILLTEEKPFEPK